MSLGNTTDNDQKFMALALEGAKMGYGEGGVPVGTVMVEDGEIIGRGRNCRVQEGNPSTSPSKLLASGRHSDTRDRTSMMIGCTLPAVPSGPAGDV